MNDLLEQSAVETEVSSANSPSAPPRRFERESPGASGISVLTLVIWVSCLGIGVLGFALPYPRPQAKPVREEVLVAQKLEVELTNEAVNPEELPAPDPLAPPPPPDAVAQPQVPALIPVAQPSAAVAFAVPVEGPVRIVPVKQALYTRAGPAKATVATAKSLPAAPASPVEQLSFGHGEGKQVAPVYPLRAKREGQEGTVTVRLQVDATGRVTSAEAIEPSPWPLLNDEAVDTVRRRWKFTPSTSQRVFDVPIRFCLPK